MIIKITDSRGCVYKVDLDSTSYDIELDTAIYQRRKPSSKKFVVLLREVSLTMRT